jgi:hypothetical protein
MEISHSHRFIFVRVYRVAGESMIAALRPYTYVPPRRFVGVPVLRRLASTRLQRLHEHNFGHVKAKQLRAALPRETFDGYFKFAFVRNPWDWQVSVYHYVRQRLDHPDHDLFASFGGFGDYLDWRINDQGAELQTEFVLSNSGELLVDFVGHYDTLAADFATVCDRIGIEASLPHVNRSAHGSFRDYYTPETRALVAQAYRDDIEYFGYDFETAATLPPLERLS